MKTTPRNEAKETIIIITNNKKPERSLKRAETESQKTLQCVSLTFSPPSQNNKPSLTLFMYGKSYFSTILDGFLGRFGFT